MFFVYTIEKEKIKKQSITYERKCYLKQRAGPGDVYVEMLVWRLLNDLYNYDLWRVTLIFYYYKLIIKLIIIYEICWWDMFFFQY